MNQVLGAKMQELVDQKDSSSHSDEHLLTSLDESELGHIFAMSIADVLKRDTTWAQTIVQSSRFSWGGILKSRLLHYAREKNFIGRMFSEFLAERIVYYLDEDRSDILRARRDNIDTRNKHVKLVTTVRTSRDCILAPHASAVRSWLGCNVAAANSPNSSIEQIAHFCYPFEEHVLGKSFADQLAIEFRIRGHEGQSSERGFTASISPGSLRCLPQTQSSSRPLCWLQVSLGPRAGFPSNRSL